MEGFVKWFDSKRGWGFISAEDQEDYFAHWSEIAGDGWKLLVDDEEVTFEPGEDDQKRLKALNIIRRQNNESV